MGRVARVELVQGGPARVVEVPPGGLEVGRGETAQLMLDAPSVSKRHCRLFWDGDDLLVEDLGSTNKVHRDGLLCEGRTVLHDSDELVLGEVVLRISIIGSSTLIPVSQLADTASALTPRPTDTGPNEVEQRAAELLPVVEQFFHARDVRDLARKVVQGVKAAIKVSRVALVEIEPYAAQPAAAPGAPPARALPSVAEGQLATPPSGVPLPARPPTAPPRGELDRLRVLAVEGARDISFVSRTVVSEAMKRGVSLHQLGAVGRPMAPSLADANAASAVAVMVRSGERLRVLYADLLAQDLPQLRAITWRHAFELQMIASSAASAFAALEQQQKNSKDRLRFEHLRRHFSPSLVEQLALITRPDEEFLAPQILPATVVFADLSGVTRLTERWRSRPRALISLLDLWFEQASRAVFGQSGTLDKFIGDGVMAVFGAPFALDGASARALHTVADLQRAVAQLARDTSESLAVTASICSGPVLSCTTGSRRRHEFTVLGETVGRAARLKDLAAPGEVLLDETSAAELSQLAEFDMLTSPPGVTSGPIWRLRAYRTA